MDPCSLCLSDSIENDATRAWNDFCSAPVYHLYFVFLCVLNYPKYKYLHMYNNLQAASLPLSAGRVHIVHNKTAFTSTLLLKKPSVSDQRGLGDQSTTEENAPVPFLKPNPTGAALLFLNCSFQCPWKGEAFSSQATGLVKTLSSPCPLPSASSLHFMPDLRHLLLSLPNITFPSSAPGLHPPCWMLLLPFHLGQQLIVD